MAIFSVPSSPNIVPATKLIIAITQDNPALVTTSDAYPTSVDPNHYYSTGMKVRLRIPRDFGMYQADKLIGTITVVSDDTFTIDIDTSGFDPFSIPTTLRRNFAQVFPAGEIATKLDGATYNNRSSNV